MKLVHKIGLFYTAITVIIIILVIIIFNVSLSHFLDKIYYSSLLDKAYITAEIHFEKDEFDDLKYNKALKKHKEVLPRSKELILNINQENKVREQLRKYFNPEQIENLIKTTSYEYFKKEDSLGVALHYSDNEGEFIVVISSVNTYGQQIKKNLLSIVFVIILIILPLIYFVGVIYSNRVMYPLKNILKQLKQIKSSNINKRLRLGKNKDELYELTSSINEMLENIDESVKMEKSFISNSTHELNNPLTAIIGECEITLMKNRSENEYISSLKRIFKEADRMLLLTKSLLFLSKQEMDILQENKDRIELKSFIENKCNDYNESKRFSRVVFEDYSRSLELFIYANESLLTTAIINVIDNACKYSQEQIYVRLFDDEQIKICVYDKGIGISEEDINRVFQMFYRSSSVRGVQGHGIGLSLSKKIFNTFEAEISINSKENEFTEVEIRFLKT